MMQTSFSAKHGTRRLLMSRSRSANGTRGLSRFKTVASKLKPATAIMSSRQQLQGVLAQSRQPIVVEGSREQSTVRVHLVAPFSRDTEEERVYDAPAFDMCDDEHDRDTERVDLGNSDDDNANAMAVSTCDAQVATKTYDWITADQVLEYLLDGRHMASQAIAAARLS